jgi:AraC family transcriptional regulator
MLVHSGSTAIRRFLRGKSSMRLSSSNLRWSGLALEEHVASPGERPEVAIDCFMLLLCQGSAVACGENLDSRGRFVRYTKEPGTMSLFSPGAVPWVRTWAPSDFLLGALDRKLLQEVGDELRDQRAGYSPDGPIVRDQPAFKDAALRQILLLLGKEAQSGGLSGPLYAEHLAQALALRLFALSHTDSGKRLAPATPLPSNILRRLIERIEENPLARFDLASLAAESGYSRSYFLRTFRASTGFSPHQYIVHLRLERAKKLMRQRSLTLLEIALESGFASHAHFSHAFRQHFGIAPSTFRSTSLGKRILS